MSISDNLLSAFMCGVANMKENNELLKEALSDRVLSDVIELIDDIDSSDDIDELRNEFHEDGDKYTDFKELGK